MYINITPWLKPTFSSCFSSSSAVVSSWCVTSITGCWALALVPLEVEVEVPLEVEVEVEVEVEGGPSSLPITDTLVCHSSNDFNCGFQIKCLKFQNTQRQRERGVRIFEVSEHIEGKGSKTHTHIQQQGCGGYLETKFKESGGNLYVIRLKTDAWNVATNRIETAKGEWDAQ